MFKKLIGAAVVALLPFAAQSAPLDPGKYEVQDLNDFRSIWTPNGNGGPNSEALVTGGSASAFWSFTNVVFDYDGSSATMTGQAENTGDAGLQLDINLSFTKLAGPVGNGPYCQFDGSGGPCNGMDPVDTSMWTFFSLDAGSTFEGAGTLNGLTYEIEDKSGHAPQAGIGAGALNGQQTLLSFSMWFDWTLVNPGSVPTSSPYTFNTSGRGDINANLAPIPLPATGLLLIAGLGGFAAMRRKKAS